MIIDIIVLIILGVIIGFLGKLLAPGDKDNTPVWLTILCGIGGILLGFFIYEALGGGDTEDFNWIQWITAVITATVLVMIASTVSGRNNSNHSTRV
ncbi:GlsB/YeaQ/YmgE family stress response membrane protein [Nocardioides sp.]|uniref:GlsB/YeaQ/YmgE family stress response membrane protein n=1 Tax=Nocardioides sp. TaxID=35761 RepID=UPI002CF51F86|nr:GlsB/YeaQ/YmgE family stress response membrane protein [Nocardioides sp.]HXH80487.1 GlsB/YeaQ/YmgE family stress response membrane protein [Nocardioides sp.]